MRRLAALLLALLVALCAGSTSFAGDAPLVDAERAEAFEMTLTLRADVRAHERISHRFEVKLDGRLLTYTGPVGEPRNNRYETSTIELELDDEMFARILEVLDEHALIADFAETPGERNKGESIVATLTTSDLGKTTSVNLNGTTNAFGDDAGEPALLSDDAGKRAAALLGLCWTLKELVESETDLGEHP